MIVMPPYGAHLSESRKHAPEQQLDRARASGTDAGAKRSPLLLASDAEHMSRMEGVFWAKRKKCIGLFIERARFQCLSPLWLLFGNWYEIIIENSRYGMRLVEV